MNREGIRNALPILTPWVHAGRTFGGHRDHRHLDWPVSTGGAEGPRIRRAVSCQNNLKQLALAVHSFHEVQQCFPTYNGICPIAKNSTLQAADTYGIYGSWIVHLLPYFEQLALYELILADVEQFTNTGAVITTAGGTLISPAVAAYWSPAPTLVSAAIPATYNQWNAEKVQEYVTSTNGNGYTISTLEWVPAQFADPGTNIGAVYNYAGCTLIPAVAAVYGPPGIADQRLCRHLESGQSRDANLGAAMSVRSHARFPPIHAADWFTRLLPIRGQPPTIWRTGTCFAATRRWATNRRR